MLQIASCVGAVQICSKSWCYLELSAEIMAKRLMIDNQNLFSSGTYIQNYDIYSKICSHRGATRILIEKIDCQNYKFLLCI